MFKLRRTLRFLLAYSFLFFLFIFWYLSQLESNESRSSSSSPQHRLAVIVPYRNRSSELQLFLSHMHSFLINQSIEHVFFIVHQTDQHRFNRAALINIGFLESRALVDYLVMHDIDLLPLNVEQMSYRYPENGPVHLASPEYHPIYHYSTYVGGILMISSMDFERVNGMSPLYWGWGREDDNFYVRMKLAGMIIDRPKNLSTNSSNTFRHIHQQDVHQRDYAKYGRQKEEGRKIYPAMGFNTTNYKIIVKDIRKSNEGVEYVMLDVNIFCDYDLTPWCDHPK